MYTKGVNDCIAGIKPQSDDKEYLSGYGDQYAREAELGALQNGH